VVYVKRSHIHVAMCKTKGKSAVWICKSSVYYNLSGCDD